MMKLSCLLAFLLFSNYLLTSCTSRTDQPADDADSSGMVAADSVTTVNPDSTYQRFARAVDSVYEEQAKQTYAALLAGNWRFRNDSTFASNLDNQIPDSLKRKKPFILLTDIDLPQSANQIFDLPRSMFLQLSSPACLVDSRQIGVMEYAVKHSGSRVILVLSNSSSRIIGAACDNVSTAHFSGIKSDLAKAMSSAQEFADRSSANKEFVNNIAQSQARLSASLVLNSSPELKMLADSGRIIIKSAFYDTVKKSVILLDAAPSLNPSTKN